LARFWKFSTGELLLLIAIGVITPLLNEQMERYVFGTIFTFPSVSGLSNYLFAQMGGPLLGDFVDTWLQYGAILAACLVRKPGSGTIAMTINGFGQVYLNGTHQPHLLYGVTGLGADIVFGLFRYKRYDFLSVPVAGVACSMFWYPIVYFTHFIYIYPTSFIVSDFLVRVFTGAVGNGLFGAGLALLLAWMYRQLVVEPGASIGPGPNAGSVNPGS
jgi:ABC-type thiamin/hydroxymethylpyrimidine transport system permease subunit